MSELREILERAPSAEESEDEISEKLTEAREIEEAIIQRLDLPGRGKPSLNECMHILGQLEESRAKRAEVEAAQLEKVNLARKAVADQEAWLLKIEEAIKSVK